MKKFLSVFLALVMALSLAAFASADETLPTFDQLVWGENADLTAPAVAQMIKAQFDL